MNGPTSKDRIVDLQQELLLWYETNRRDLPWRRTNDPYEIWISETMLQQTRVAAVIPFYKQFLARFPSVDLLAAASERDVLAAWAGLGYYYRARNLQRAARAITVAGKFPRTYDELASLPGIGAYTAAAVASIALGLPHPVVDGNVYRVLSRLFNDETNVASPIARKHFSRLAESIFDRGRPGPFNQALMELGATVCLPKRPQCLLCPIQAHCAARQLGVEQSLPVRIKSGRKVEERRRILWVEERKSVLAWKRPADSRLMPGFWELPEATQLPDAIRRTLIGSFRHSITFHQYRFEVWHAELKSGAGLGPCEWLDPNSIETLPLSTIFRKAIRLQRRPVLGTKSATRSGQT